MEVFLHPPLAVALVANLLHEKEEKGKAVSAYGKPYCATRQPTSAQLPSASLTPDLHDPLHTCQSFPMRSGT